MNESLHDLLETHRARRHPDLPFEPPRRFDAGDPGARAELEALLRSGRVTVAFDTLLGQLGELVDTRNPRATSTPESIRALVAAHLGDRDPDGYGTWIYYPWSGYLVRVLPEAEFRELRTSRNRNKITAEEQAKLRSLRLGVVGLSVGQATAVTLALEEVGGEYLLADFDRLELSNMNRLRAGVHDIGVHKAVLTAREIFEINPYAKVRVFPEGITPSNLDVFLAGERKLDILFEECDDLVMKIRLREKAREHRIPVLMETSDRGLIDVERFDLEPDRPILHGLIGDLKAENLKGLSTYDKVPIVMKIIGEETMSSRFAASLVDIETTLKTWPQLASAVVLGGALNTNTARRLALGQFTSSGRYFVDLDSTVSDVADGAVAEPPSYDVEIAKTELSAPSLFRARGSTPTEDELRELVGFATLAPSGGNTQPWRFVFRDNELECYVDPERAGTLLDFEGRASELAIGAALENLCLAARAAGFEPDVALPPAASPSDPCFRVGFRSGAQLSDEDAALAAALGLRVTNRKLGPRQPLTGDESRALLATARAAHAELVLLEEPEQLDRAASLIGRGERLRLLNPRMHREMMGEVRWTARAVDETRDGLDLRTLEFTPTDVAGMRLVSVYPLMELVGKLGAGQGLERPTRKAVAAAAAVGLVSVSNAGRTSYFAGGRALERVWLRATALGLAFQPMTPLLYLFPRLLEGGGAELDQREQAELGELHREFEALFGPRGSRVDVMLFRLARVGPPTARSLRRRVDDVLTIER
jgi:molybdopterin/thiamine biosynthesis adenylyltransferase